MFNRFAFLVLVSLSGVSMAHAIEGASEGGVDAGKGARFSEHKQQIVQEMEAKITALQTAKSCISSAQDHVGVRACREALEKAHKEIRNQQIDQQIQRLQAEKSKSK